MNDIGRLTSTSQPFGRERYNIDMDQYLIQLKMDLLSMEKIDDRD
ncbi:hypothetical protein ACET8C_08720 [Aeromonas veronii]